MNANILPHAQAEMQVTVCRDHSIEEARLQHTISALQKTVATLQDEVDRERDHNSRLQRLYDALTAKERAITSRNRDQAEMLCAVYQEVGSETFARILESVPCDQATPTLSAMAGVVAEIRAGGQEPQTRPLTTADRLPEVGDVLNDHRIFVTVDEVGQTSIAFSSQSGSYARRIGAFQLRIQPFPYLSRADGGPVTAELLRACDGENERAGE